MIQTLTLHSQQSVSMATGDGGHQVGVGPIQLHRLWALGGFLLSAQAPPGALPPGAYLTI